LNVSAWLSELSEDFDSEFLSNGILHGFDIINPDADLHDVFTQNHRSALDPDNVNEMDAVIRAEIDEGNYVITDVKPVIVSALGAVRKSDGSIRPIHDCSLPVNSGVNAHAPTFEHYSYESVDDAVKLIKPGFYCGKIDIRHAYRCISISKQSTRATGLYWKFQDGQSVFLSDRKLCFGSSASPIIFHRISQAIKRMMERRGYVNQIVAYQDDYLVIGQDYDQALDVFTVMLNLLRQLGLPVNYNKLVHPTTCLTFLGLQLDTIRCEVSLPADKLESIRACVNEFSLMKRANKQQLQRLAGRLSFAARVVRGGRLFLRRLFNAISTLKKRHHKIRIKAGLKGDISWWRDFLVQFNGVSAFVDVTDIAIISTDACLVAGGAFFNGDVYFTVWEADFPDVCNSPINYKEAMIATLGIKRWAPLFKNKCVYIYTDNQCAVSILNKCTCKSEYLMRAMREMFWISVTYNFVIKARYMPGCLQTMPDALSRMHETNGLLRVESLLNDWHACHSQCKYFFCCYNLLNHMTLHSLLYILEQVMAWRRVKFR
jgi:hypothetical protein